MQPMCIEEQGLRRISEIRHIREQGHRWSVHPLAHSLQPRLAADVVDIGTERRERVEETIAPERLVADLNVAGEGAAAAKENAAESSEMEAAAAFYPTPEPAKDDAEQPLSATDTTDNQMGAYPSLVSRFMSLWLPDNPDNRRGPTIVWLGGVAQLEHPEPPLRVALQALAANRVASASGNTVLYEEGQQCYGEALGLLKTHLGAANSIADDQALSAARILMLYEVG